MTTQVTLIACVLCLVAGAAAAQSRPAPDAPVTSQTHRVVSYADLDLGTAAGRETLARRIRGAAEAVCPSPSRLLAVEAERRACLRGAVESGEAQVAAIADYPVYAEAPRTVRVTPNGGF